MRKKIRIFVVAVLIVLILIIIGAGAYVYNLKSEKKVVIIPTTNSPKTLELTRILSSSGFNLESNPFEENGSITASISGSTVVFSNSKDLKKQVKALQLLNGSLKMEDKRPREIDLRFEKVVLRY